MDEETKEYKLKQKMKEDWVKLKNKFGDSEAVKTALDDAQETMQKIIDYVIEESEDFANAFWLAVIFGEEAREKALDQGGDPEPERRGFEAGLICKKLLNDWIISQLAGIDPTLSKIINISIRGDTDD